MHRITNRYQRLSFRGRLLSLLVVVSLIQAGVAAYTFFQLQTKPAEQRIQAQLNAAMRGVAPVLDSEIERADERLTELVEDPALQPAIESSDWTQVSDLIGDGPSAFDTGSVTAPDPQIQTGATDGDASAKAPLVAYVTDSSGQVVAGTKPEGALVERAGVTSRRITRGAELVATVNVPVAIDAEFFRDRLEQYIPKGVDVFVADDESLISTGAEDSAPMSRPAGLHPGLQELKLRGKETQALVQPLFDGSVMVGASIPLATAKAQASDGQTSLWGFVALLALLMIGVAFFITRAVGDALRKFAEIARDLAGGQLGRRIPVTGTDEIATLSESFNDMAENLQDRIVSLEDARVRMRRQVELFGDALANATEVNVMLQSVCSLAMESSHATHARFWTIDEDGRYEHAACIGLRPNDTEPCGLEKAVAVRNGAVRGKDAPYWLVVPARRSDGQINGLLTLVSTAADFSEDDVRMAERIAVQAAVGLDNARLHEQLRLQATRDGLTGLPNHRSIQDELTKRLEEAYATNMPLGICMLDIDNFKRVNDTYGHPIGDEAIKAIGKTLAHGIGGMGMVGRYGGEEFVVIMPGCDAGAATRIADRLREDITRIEVPLEDGGILRVTSSFGVANVDQQHPGVRVENAELLHQADVGMYNSKRSGKNCVTLAGPDTTVIEMSEVEKAKLAARERGDAAAEQQAAAALETAPPAAAYEDPFDFAA